MERLQNRVALVTGGASGIGRAIALRLAAEGASVVIVDVTTEVKEGGEPTHKLLEQAGHPSLLIRADVSAEAEVENAVAQTVAQFGQIDIVVNNAVLVVGKPLLETSYEEWNRALAVGIGGVFLMCRAAVRRMIEQPERDGITGRIINISSQFGFLAAPEDVSYGVAKSGCAYITRQIAVDYAKQGIVCNSVSPGKIITGKPGRSMEQRWIDFSHARTPMPRLGRPTDVANAVLFLASDEASFMTGANLAVDGGWLAG